MSLLRWLAMRGPRNLGMWLLSAGWIILAGGGCTLVSSSEDASTAAHLPPVEVSLPGKPQSGQSNSAPLWKPAGASGNSATKASAAAANAPIENPAQELKQLLGQLLASGSIDRATHDDMLKNVDRTDPETLRHLVWMYRSVAQGPTTATAVSDKALPATVGASSPSNRHHGNSKQAGEREPEPVAVVANEATSPEKTTKSQESPSKTSTAPALTEPSSVTTREPTTARPTVASTPSTDAPASLDWRAELNQTIQAMEAAADTAPADERQRIHTHLRMMYLTAGRKNDALKPLPLANENEQDFWSQELYGLATYLDEERLGDRGRRAAEASRHLSQAVARLGESSPLVVRNLAFCSEVSSYGVYTSFAKHDFKPGQQVLLYAEIENFRSEETPKGFHTSLKSHYQIVDPQGRKVDEHDFAVAEERCQNPRRDYFVRYFVTLPPRIYDGRYTLQLTVEDTLGKKVGQSTIEFTVKSK